MIFFCYSGEDAEDEVREGSSLASAVPEDDPGGDRLHQGS